MLLGPQSFQTAGDGQPGLPGAPSLYIHAFPLAVLPGSHLPAVLSLSPVELAASCPVHPGRSGVSPLVSCASSCLWPWSLQIVPRACVLAVALLLPTSPWTCRFSPPRALGVRLRDTSSLNTAGVSWQDQGTRVGRSGTWGFGFHSCMKPEAVGNGRRTVEVAAGRPRSDASWLPVS